MTNYQKMCAAAKEIQEAWEPKVGDMIYILSTDKIIHLDCLELADDLLTGMYWLPRIEDLMAMLPELAPVGFVSALFSGMSAHTKDIEAMKAWLLQMIMSVLHNKSWDGERWT